MASGSGGTEPCPPAHGDSTEVRGFKNGGNDEKCDQSAAEREIPAHVAQSVLGWWWGLGTRISRLYGGHQRSDHSAAYAAQGKQETGQAQLEL